MTGVILGAFGAHALRGRLSAEMLAIWRTAEQYQFIHSLGLLAIGLAGLHFGQAAGLRWAGWLMTAGIVLFSGSLYVLAISGTRTLGAVTPIGGVCFIAAWAVFAVTVLRAA